MECKSVVFSGHAIRRMFQRGLSMGDVLAVIRQGEVIADYPDDIPYPSCLLLGFVQNKPAHVVLAIAEGQTCMVITAYVPEAELWSDDFKTRRKQ